MTSIMDKILSETNEYVKSSSKNKEFVAEYSVKEISDVDWVSLCDYVKKHGCYKIGFLFMRELLRQNQYSGYYSDELYDMLVFFNKMGHQRPFMFKGFMCGVNLPRLIVYRQGKRNASQWYDYCNINTENKYIKSMFTQYLNIDRAAIRMCTKAMIEVFEESFGKYRNTLISIEGFTSKTMFTQAKFYRKHFAEDDKQRNQALGIIVYYYRWLVSAFPEHSFYKDAFDMSEHLLFNKRLPELLERGFYFTTLNPVNIPYGKVRICYLLRGLDNHSTIITNDDCVSIDYSHLQSPFYRDLLIEYTSTTLSVSTVKYTGYSMIICDGMQALHEVKLTKGYPNKKPDYLSNQEAIFIKQRILAQETGLVTKNNKIGTVRRFISFCVDRKAIKTDDLFFDHLTQFDVPNKSTAQTVSDDGLIALHKALSEKGKADLFFKEMLVIFHLAIQTEFRINQICHLKVDCIKPTVKPNQFMLQTNSKTSFGRKNNYVVSALTYNLLIDIIEETESIRENSCITNTKDYIFVYGNKNHIAEKTVIFSDRTFSRSLKKICNEIGIEPCTATNLRDTHMTKALEHIMRSGKSDIEMSALSKHKHMDTTKNHYIEMELEKMLESTYGIIIGTELIETDSKVVDDIPEYLAGEDNDVEDGCGKCSAETCVMTNTLPCLACNYFITTPMHEVFFRKAIDNVTRLIANTRNRHDKEGLVTIKELYVLYLKAIIVHKEGIVKDE